MKERLALCLLIIVLAVSPLEAATWYAGANCASGNMSACDWFPTQGASCADGTGTKLTWAERANGDVFNANGCTVVLDADPGSASVIPTLTTDATNGGGFTLATAALNGFTSSTAHFNVLGSSHAGAVVTISGTTGGGTISGTGGSSGGTCTGCTTGCNFQGGTASTSNAYAFSDTHTSVTLTVNGNICGGGSSAYANAGYFVNGVSPITINGNCTSQKGSPGFNGGSGATSGTMIVNGNCVGNNDNYGVGCSANFGAHVVVTGNILHGHRGAGTAGGVLWQPAANTNYILYPRDTSVTLGTYDSHAVQGPAMDAALGATNINTLSNVKTGVTYGTKTGTMSSSGGGGAWAF